MLYKKYSALFIHLLFIGGILGFLTIPFFSYASATDNVSGWVWSETIGWISLNCTNEPGVCTNSPYGVNVDSVGNISGYAWSENIGWLSLNSADTTGCQTAPCNAHVDFSTGQILGWARACSGTVNGNCTGGSRTDGWDGWIHLSGTIAPPGSGTYGVAASGCVWQGWSWGSDVVGAVSFTCNNENVCTSSNYGINGTGFACVASQPLTASCTVTPTPTAGYGETGIPLSWNGSATGGVAPYTAWSWSGDVTGTTQNVDKTFSTIGTKISTVTVTDTSSATASGSCSVNIVTPIFWVTPATATLGSGDTVQLYANYDFDGSGGAFGTQDKTTLADWTSSNSTIASVNNTTSKGLVTAGTTSGSATITATHTDSYGKAFSANSTVTVSGQILSFIATPSKINPGATSTLSWSTTGFVSCLISDNNPSLPDIGSVPTNSGPGGRSVSPLVTTTFTLTCTDSLGGTVSKDVIVSVSQVPKFKEVKPK